MKKELSSYKELEIPESILNPLLGVNKQLDAVGIYSRLSLASVLITGLGNYKVICGFAPRMVQANTQETDDTSQGTTDFKTTYSIRSYSGGLSGFLTSESINLIKTGNLVGNITKREYDGFILNISSFSGSNKTIFFNCYS